MPYNKRKSILFFVLLIVAICIIYMKRTSINQKQIKYLPKFNIDVESGNKINSRDLIGNYSLLLFLDDRDDNDMVFLSSLVDYIDKYNVNTVAFVRKKNNALLKNLGRRDLLRSRRKGSIYTISPAQWK